MNSSVRRTFEHYRAHLEQLESLFPLGEFCSQGALPDPAVTGGDISSTPRPLLPEPDKLYAAYWKVWYPYMLAKLRIDGKAIGNAETKFWYVYACLEPNIQVKVLDLVDSKPLSHDNILQRLRTLYDGSQEDDDGDDEDQDENEGSPETDDGGRRGRFG